MWTNGSGPMKVQYLTTTTTTTKCRNASEAADGWCAPGRRGCAVRRGGTVAPHAHVLSGPAVTATRRLRGVPACKRCLLQNASLPPPPLASGFKRRGIKDQEGERPADRWRWIGDNTVAIRGPEGRACACESVRV